MFPVVSLFKSRVENIEQYFCQFTGYQKLEKTFDDTKGIDAYLIKEQDGNADFSLHEIANMGRARKTFNIWLQFKEDNLGLIVKGLMEWISCSGENLISINTDSSAVFKELTGEEHKGYDNEGTDFRYAKISVSLVSEISGKLCNIC